MRITLALATIATLCFGSPGLTRANGLLFNRDIRPILAEKCFHCHGQDPQSRKAGLRLDTFEGATRRRDGNPAVAPRDVAKSELVTRIFSTDEDDLMPPPDSHRPLSNEEKRLLKQWIGEGASYESHWAFVPPRRATVPTSARADWGLSPIDAFVLDRLQRDGLSPSPAAQPEIWLRRVTFDLVGLPPTTAEIDTFLGEVASVGERAYASAVDRLLASPHFGERMAQDWLDVARYADTHGFNNDSARSMWRWRDWVIDAFNEGLPYDRFITEQLAGDLLPNPTIEQKLATGFNRNHVINSEGGIIDEEYRTEYVVDRVRTLGMAWMGLTLECARCHDHKYDPIAQRDFYGLFAFFNNVPEIGEDGRVANAAPFFPAPSRAEQRQLADLDHAIETQTDRLNRIGQRTSTPINTAPGETRAPVGLDVELGLSVNQPWTFASWASAPGVLASTMEMSSPPSSKDHGRGAEIRITDDGAVEFRMAERWPAYAIAAQSRGRIRTGQRHHVVVAYDGSQVARGVRIFIDGRESSTEVVHDDLPPSKSKKMPPRPIATASDWQIFGRLLSADEIATWSENLLVGWLNSPQGAREGVARRNFLQTVALRRSSAEYERIFVAREGLRQSRLKLERVLPTAMVMVENTPRPTHVLMRGQYNLPGEAVTARVPEQLLGAWPTDAPRNRLGLARWLTGANHPLTGRVVVNRLWQQLFGTGLVKTTEDFGLQGEFPSHPELLDWLARSFVDGGWRVKVLLREIALSSTYRQDSAASALLRERDPDNRLLARGPRVRLSAEMIRDQMLAASGLFRPRLGGPSVFPYQPSDLYKGIVVDADYPGTRWVQSVGDDLYRRSIYTFWKRTVLHPTLAIFDAPDREVCLSRRTVTNTPLQALTLMNEPGAIESARALAQRALHEAGSGDDKQLSWVFRVVTSRSPTAKERQSLRHALQRFRDAFAADRRAARAFISVGASPPDRRLRTRDLAAMTSTVSLIFNLSETVSKH